MSVDEAVMRFNKADALKTNEIPIKEGLDHAEGQPRQHSLGKTLKTLWQLCCKSGYL
jgi:hypothetical protein